MTKRLLLLSAITLSFSLPACATPAPKTPAAPTNHAQAPIAKAPIPKVTPRSEQRLESQSEQKFAQTAPPQTQTRAVRYANWKIRFKNEALARGYSQNLLNKTIDPATINPKALERNKSQPEFTRPIWEYIDGAASADRVSKGKAKLTANAALFNDLEARYTVPRYILTAIWGLESSYGNILGTHDIISALSTFAFEGRRSKFGEEQLYAVLDLLKRGDVRPSQLKGSWAGAMGMTQFIPTTFRDYAVDYDRNGNIDLWKSSGDALGSAANYLKRSGWQAGEPVIADVRVPNNFDYRLADGRKKTVSEWRALGVTPTNGMAFSPQAQALKAKLLVPTGGNGPKLLTFKNYDAIKRYNNSTSYVLGITVLANAYRGRDIITTAWPKNDLPLSFTNRKRLQESLTQLGYNTKGVDGQIGPNSRKAIRAFQSDNQMPADGYATPQLLKHVLDKLRG